MSKGFVHSVKVPRLYKITAQTVKNVEEEGASLKQLIYEKKHPNLAGTFALALTTLQHGSQVDELLRKTQLLFKEPRFDPWLARVLITELLWGKQKLSSEAKPIQTILTYEKILRDESKNLDTTAITRPISNNVQKPKYVRVNTLVNSIEDAIRSFEDDGWKILPKSRDYASFLISLSRLDESRFIQDFHVPELFAFPPGTQFHDHPSYKCGAIVLQDKASCLPAHLLKPTPGSTVLDMCAAPGMKTTHLAAIMQNKGNIFAVERDARRYGVLQKLVQDTCANCVTTVNADATSLDPNKCPNVEYILVDPSCSGSGMSDRPAFENAVSKCAPGRLRSLQSFQVLILRHALLNFPTVKRVVYSTCSIYPEENEMVIDELLADFGESYKLSSVKELLGGNWKNFSSTNYACKDNCLYAKPEIDFSNGFFVAVFERNFDVPLPEFKRRKGFKKPENSEESVKRENGDGENEHSGTKRRKKNKSNDKSVNELEQSMVDEKLKVEDDDGNSPKKKSKKNKSHDQTEGESTMSRVKYEVKDKEENVSKKKHKKNKLNGETESASKILRVEDEVKDKDENTGKKKRKKNELNGATESQPSTITVDIDIELIKKKRESTELNINDTNELVRTEGAINRDEATIEKKKKKKKRSGSVIVIQEVDLTTEVPAHEVQKVKKKKKKREIEDFSEEVPENLEGLTGDKISKKKSKFKHTEPEKIEEINAVSETSDRKIEKKKKKKKKVKYIDITEKDISS